MSSALKPMQVPYTGPAIEDVTEVSGDTRWSPHFEIAQLAAADTVEIPQTTIAIVRHQRFEIWRGGRIIGMATVTTADALRAIVRFDEPFDGQALAVGDEVRSDIWRPDRSVRVAIHGTIDPDAAGMTRAQLEAALRDAGAHLDENAVEGTDLVVLGSNLLDDAWYRKARTELKFELIKDEDMGRYFHEPN